MTTTKYFSNVTSAKLVFFLCVLCALCVSTNAQTFKQVHPGVEYAQVEHKLGSDPVKINLLRLDLKKVRLDVHHALDKAIGLETTSSIAKRKGAVAAINAGFFRLDKSAWAGDAVGALVVDGELYSDASNGRVTLAIYSGGKDAPLVEIGHLDLLARIDSPKIEFPDISGVNRERKADEIVLYSGKYGATTRTSDLGAEVVIDQCEKNRCKRFSILEGVNNTPIPERGFVLSIDTRQEVHQAFLESLKGLSRLSRNDKRLLVQLVAASRPPAVREIELRTGLDITNGIPQLIKNGKIDITWEQEKASKSFAETRHPRTAVAKLKDGKFLMMTVDGRQPGVSVGMSLQELAEYLFSLGAVDAMNLDGGGSTTMFLDGKVVNTPSDKEGERKIGDAIVVTLRKKS